LRDIAVAETGMRRVTSLQMENAKLAALKTRIGTEHLDNPLGIGSLFAFIASSVVFTHDAAAITTRPVSRSTASTDHVANADDGNNSSNVSRPRVVRA
jgi:hypothetical protein